MAIEKTTIVDRIEILESGCVQVREAIRIVEDGAVISTSHNRYAIQPGEDISHLDPKVKQFCELAHTPEVIEAYQAATIAIQPEGDQP